MIIRLIAAIIVAAFIVFNFALTAIFIEKKITGNQFAGTLLAEATMVVVGYWIITGELLWR